MGGNATGAASSAVTQRATAVQFDLAASAFPPLPGSSAVSIAVSGGAAGDVQQVPVTTVLPSTNVKNLSSAASDSSVVVAGKDVEVVAGKQSVADNNKSSNTEGSGPVAAVAAVPVVASAWGDSLADVVKGTAKAAKSSSNANGE